MYRGPVSTALWYCDTECKPAPGGRHATVCPHCCGYTLATVAAHRARAPRRPLPNRPIRRPAATISGA